MLSFGVSFVFLDCVTPCVSWRCSWLGITVVMWWACLVCCIISAEMTQKLISFNADRVLWIKIGNIQLFSSHTHTHNCAHDIIFTFSEPHMLLICSICGTYFLCDLAFLLLQCKLCPPVLFHQNRHSTHNSEFQTLLMSFCELWQNICFPLNN